MKIIVKYFDLKDPKVLIVGTDFGLALLAPRNIEPRKLGILNVYLIVKYLNKSFFVLNAWRTTCPVPSLSNPSWIPETTCFSSFASTALQYLMYNSSP